VWPTLFPGCSREGSKGKKALAMQHKGIMGRWVTLLCTHWHRGNTVFRVSPPVFVLFFLIFRLKEAINTSKDQENKYQASHPNLRRLQDAGK
jgi:hypothetical protein